ncbi:hypothetical protein Lesp02_06510 [Lentzea sp. NBRC 105346]|uniref:nuclear transport factor 2 family protein n=1 Tax=Lentzea sp. NBRC 105346 TaxID=3032205 RepID=UPI0024A5E937|nr:nuclear transport factor 2 family protein [Lentzea sp. NBRC 105346]GLZ28461.1 hypothetical protein Lesp02_06510 [Lentzea sp. NBRC 105346]
MSDVLNLVNRWAEAELKGDADGLAGLLTPDFAGIGPVGFMLDRDQWTGRHRGSTLSNDEFTVVDPHVRAFDNVALVTAVLNQKTTAMGRDTSGSFRISVLATRQDDEWAIAHVQLSGPIIAPGEVPSFAR